MKAIEQYFHRILFLLNMFLLLNLDLDMLSYFMFNVMTSRKMKWMVLTQSLEYGILTRYFSIVTASFFTTAAYSLVDKLKCTVLHETLNITVISLLLAWSVSLSKLIIFMYFYSAMKQFFSF